MWSPLDDRDRDQPPALSPTREAAILAVFDESRPVGSRRAAFGILECELMRLVGELPPVESLALARRLAVGRDDDPIVVRMLRLEPARRGRLRAFIADPRRRIGR